MARILIASADAGSTASLDWLGEAVALCKGAGHEVTHSAVGLAPDVVVFVGDSGGVGAVKSELVQGAWTPILLILPASSDDAGARVQALQYADDVLSAPVSAAEVAARVLALLRTRALIDDLRQSRSDLDARAGVDAATGLRTRAVLLERLHEEWKRAAKANQPLTLLVGTIERLDSLQIQSGTQAVERVVKAVAGAAGRALKQVDTVARWGRFQVAALLPATHFTGAIGRAETLAREIAGLLVDDARVVVSMGLSFYPGRDVASPADLVSLAERALERARTEGAGAVCLVQHQGYLFFPDVVSSQK